MKRLIFLMCAVSSYMVADEDAKGFYKLTGLDVQYYMAARYDTPINVSDIYGAGVDLTIQTINAGEIFYAVRNGPLSEAALNAISVNLNVLLNADGTGRLAEGSSYPDQGLIEGTCVSEILILPITDDLLYESDGTLSRPNAGVNVVGIPSISTYGPYDHDNDDDTDKIPHMFGGLGLSQSVVFDYFPMDPVQPQLCGNVGNCFDLCYPDGTLTDGVLDGACDLYPSSQGAPMLGYQAGYWWKEGFPGHPTDIAPTIPGNTDPDFYLEWHAIDGAAAESGLGDIIGEDEDPLGNCSTANTCDGGVHNGDTCSQDSDCDEGTDFDRILGLPYITATFINPACGLEYNYPIFGDLTGSPLDACISSVGTANDAYVMDPSGALAQWGNFLTWHAVVAQQLIPQCVAAGGLEAFGTGFCIQQATGADFAAACEYVGVYEATYGLCMQAAGPGWEATCAGLAAATEAATGGNCAAMSAVAPTVCAQAGAALAAGYGTGYGEPYDCSNYITQDHMYGADDSGADGDPTCLADGDPLDCEGRIPMNFTPTCVPEIEIREVAAEFIDVGGELCGTGDVLCDCVCDEDATNDSDCDDDDSCLDSCPSGTGLCLEDEFGAPLCSEAVNVQDIVVLVNLILSGGIPPTCGGDMNYDGHYNVVDVVQLANCVLGFSDCTSSSRADNATSIEFNVIGNEVTMSADGIVGGIQMTLSHGNDFALTLTDGGQFSDYLTKGNSTILIIVNPTDNNLFTTNGDYTIESVIATNYEGSSMLNTSVSVNLPKLYSIGSAYPNPFNPTTQITLDLNTDANVSVKIFNTLGQLVDVLANTHMASGNYSLTWDGAKAASGIYFIQTEIGSEIHNQKIMLIK